MKGLLLMLQETLSLVEFFLERMMKQRRNGKNNNKAMGEAQLPWKNPLYKNIRVE